MNSYALLIDTASIQQYIFDSSRLKENLGASYIVKHLYDDLAEKYKGTDKFGYIGGGNALFFFKEEKEAQKVCMDWTTKLLHCYPGVNVVTVIEPFDNTNFSASLARLHNALAKKKMETSVATTLSRYGFTSESPSDGLSAEYWDKDKERYISAVTATKLFFSDHSNSEIEKEYADILKDEFCFTNDQDQLGQIKHDENRIAIVHIDGNNIGKRFKELKSLEAVRNLSDSLEKAVKESFAEVIVFIINKYKTQKARLEKEGIKFRNEKGKTIIPVRPIILGGDDITFVSNGLLGIRCAEVFIKAFEKQKDSQGADLNLTACAGVTIMKTKNPFYRGYLLAEELCRHSKEKRKEKNSLSSWIDFQLVYDTSITDLEKLRYEYKSLLLRPYSFDNTECGFNTAVKLLSEFYSKPISSNKLKQLREILTKEESIRREYYYQLELRNFRLPNIKHYQPAFFRDNKTPYFDMIELTELYPESLIND